MGGEDRVHICIVRFLLYPDTEQHEFNFTASQTPVKW